MGISTRHRRGSGRCARPGFLSARKYGLALSPLWTAGGPRAEALPRLWQEGCNGACMQGYRQPKECTISNKHECMQDRVLTGSGILLAPMCSLLSNSGSESGGKIVGAPSGRPQPAVAVWSSVERSVRAAFDTAGPASSGAGRNTALCCDVARKTGTCKARGGSAARGLGACVGRGGAARQQGGAAAGLRGSRDTTKAWQTAIPGP